MGSDWQESCLSQLAHKITKGTTPTKADGGFLTSGINFIKAEAVGLDGKIDKSKFAYVSEAVHEKYSRSQLAEDDILFSMAGVVLGKTALVKREHLPANTNQALALIRPITEIILPNYLHYYLQQPAVFHYVNNSTSQSAQPNINLTEIGGLTIKVPPIAEQQAIAHILGSLDDKIELNRRMNATLEAMAQALFKSWFVDFDPVIDNALAAGHPIPAPLQERAEARAALGDQRQSLPEAIRQQFPNRFVCNEDMEWVPEGWKVVPLAEFGEIICGKTPPKSNAEYFGEEIPFIKIPDMHNEMFVIKTGEYLSESGAYFQKNKFIPRGSVCVSCIATVGKVVITTQKSQTNQQINSIVPKYKYMAPYLYFYMLTLNKLFHDLASGGSTTLNMNTGVFSKIEIIHPDIEVLKSFFNQTKALTQKIEQNLLATETLCNIRDTLLPKLLSGQLRIPEAEQQVADMP